MPIKIEKSCLQLGEHKDDGYWMPAAPNVRSVRKRSRFPVIVSVARYSSPSFCSF